MCTALINVIGSSKLEGVQKVNNIWRLYVKDKVSRLELCCKQKLWIGSKQVPLYDQNLNSSRQPVGSGSQDLPQSNDKLTIKHLPLSVSNEEIKRMLEENGVSLRSSIRYGMIRDSDGHLTSFKNGDRFVYVKPFSPPLPRKQQIGSINCTVVHHGKDVPCTVCGEVGHKVGEEGCLAAPTREIVAFRGFRHPLSNHFPCALHVWDKDFKSLEHAYLWRMATEFGKAEIAAQIHRSQHAGEAKRISKMIGEDEVRWQWERDNLNIMKDLITIKAQQCEQFHNCLLENKDKTLAEATSSKLWATGASPFITEHSSPDYWPGRNMLGALLMEDTQELLGKVDDVPVMSQESNIPDKDNLNNDSQQVSSVNSEPDPDPDPDPDPEPLHDTTSTQAHTSMEVEAVTSEHEPSGVHVSRPRNRSSPSSSKTHNISSSGSRRRGTNRDVNRKVLKKTQ